MAKHFSLQEIIKLRKGERNSLQMKERDKRVDLIDYQNYYYTQYI